MCKSREMNAKSTFSTLLVTNDILGSGPQWVKPAVRYYPKPESSAELQERKGPGELRKRKFGFNM